jgi:hypothetical protein
MAGRLGRLLDPHPTKLLFIHFPLLDAPAPAPFASTHCWLGAYVSVWCNFPTVASTCPIFKCHKIESFEQRGVITIGTCIDQLKYVGLILIEKLIRSNY